jgi:hypothetical protein
MCELEGTQRAPCSGSRIPAMAYLLSRKKHLTIPLYCDIIDYIGHNYQQRGEK